jgi:hypothetical protein
MERLIAMRIIGEAREVCSTPEYSCLKHLSDGADIDCVVAIEKDLKRLTTREKRKEYFLDVVRRSVNGYSYKHYTKASWVIGPSRLGIRGCCRSCLCHYYKISDSTLTSYCAQVKNGTDHNASLRIGDKSVPYEYKPAFREALNRLARQGVELDHSLIAAAQVPNSKEVRLSEQLHVYVCMNVCMNVCMHVCMHACMYMYMYRQLHVCVRMDSLVAFIDTAQRPHCEHTSQRSDKCLSKLTIYITYT